MKQRIPPAFCFADTDLHAGEITAMSPGKPATAGTLVNIHILKVHIHTNNPPVDEKKKTEQEEIRHERKRSGKRNVNHCMEISGELDKRRSKNENENAESD